jgi:streptogramin lyase
MLNRNKNRGVIARLSLLVLAVGLHVSCDPLLDQAVYDAKFKESTPTAAPTFSPGPGSYGVPQSVSISCSMSEAAIRYTLDGSAPTDTNGTPYSVPILVAETQTIMAVARVPGWALSGVSTAVFVIQVAEPTFAPAEGLYDSPQSVTISTTTPGAVIRYTTDGSTPTDTYGTVYGGPVTVSSTQAVKAMAYKPWSPSSTVASASYTIQVVAPTFSPGAGTFASAVNLTISTTTTGATIRYTTDGSAPSETQGTIYTVPFSVPSTQTVRAIAYKAGLPDSAVAAAAYVITEWAERNGLSSPMSVTLDTNGHIYVADFITGPGQMIYMDDMSGAGWTAFGGYASPLDPTGVVVDSSGRIYMADYGGSSIDRMDNASGAGWVTLGGFSYPYGIALDASGRIYASDALHEKIIRVNDMTGSGRTEFGTQGTGVNQFTSGVQGIAVDSGGHIYIVDYGNNRIVRIDDMTGTGWVTLGTQGSGPLQFDRPTGIAVDGSGRIYVADSGNLRIARVNDMGGAGWTSIGTPGSGANQFNEPRGIAVDGSSRCFVADRLNNRIVRFIIP